MSARNQFFQSWFIENVFILCSFVKDSFDVYRILVEFGSTEFWFCFYLSLRIYYFIVFWPLLFQMRSKPLIGSINLLVIFPCRLHNFHFVFYYINVFLSLFSIYSLFTLDHFYCLILKFTYCFFYLKSVV